MPLRSSKLIEMNTEQDIKKNPFQVPEGYFDSFPEKVKARILKEEDSGGSGRKAEERISEQKPIRLKLARQLSWAASLIGLALISSALLKVLVFDRPAQLYEEIALMEETGYYDSDYYLYREYQEEEALEDEEAFALQAEDYLVRDHNELDYIFDE